MTQKKRPPVFLILIAICCNFLIGNNFAPAQTDVAARKSYKEIIYNNSKLASDYDRERVTDVFVDYMLLKNYLAKGNTADAQFTALTMLDVIADYRRTMDPKYLSDSKKFSEEMAKLKDKFKQSATIYQLRVNFSTLNNNFMNFIKSYGLYNKTIYLYQCNDNPAYGNGYWMSNSITDKMNPYADKNSRTDCYNVKESWTFK